MTGENFAYLVMVDPICNNNKFYRMMMKNGVLLCEYGRVGNSGAQKTYPASKWDSLYRQKIGKGYQDMTDMVATPQVEEVETEKPTYKPIDDAMVRRLVDDLQRYAHIILERNYEISYKKVTKKMISSAQKEISDLQDIAEDGTVEEFNEALLKLFTIIPRSMGHVASHMAKSKGDFEKILQHEQDLLDIMKGQVLIEEKENKRKEKPKAKPQNDITILESLGIEIEQGTDDDMQKILKMYNGNREITRVYKAKNLKTEKKFQDYVEKNNIKKRKLLWHGTRNENVWSILGSGLLLNPKAVITGKMFGHGIYFAPSAQKSLGYTSLCGAYWTNGRSNRGYMLIFETAYGKPQYAHDYHGNYGSLTHSNFKKRYPDKDCLHAKAGSCLRNDEIIFYDEAQMTLRYIVEF